MKHQQKKESGEALRRAYEAPTVEAKGRVEDLTQWIGGAFGEFFSGEGSGWNPWKSAGGS